MDRGRTARGTPRFVAGTDPSGPGGVSAPVLDQFTEFGASHDPPERTLQLR